MKRVYKYPFAVQDTFAISMPKGAEVLHIQEQHGEPCLWALVDPKAPNVLRGFRLAGTGQPLHYEETLRHVGSFFMRGGALVFHLFEVKP